MICFLLVFSTLLFSGSAHADKRDLLGSFRDWDAFTIKRDNGEMVCYMISVPKSWTSNPKNVRRGEIYITITHRPKAKVRDEVNIIAGYPFRNGSSVSANIDGGKYTLFTQGDGAWLRTPRDDANMVTAMKRGNRMTVNGTSSRGTDTTDRYSLSGFTAAYGAISKACP